MVRSPEISLVVGKNVTAYGWGSEQLMKLLQLCLPPHGACYGVTIAFTQFRLSQANPCLFLLFILNLFPLF